MTPDLAIATAQALLAVLLGMLVLAAAFLHDPVRRD